MQAATDIVVDNTNHCVTFSYDYNNDGTLPALGTAGYDERFAYRLINNKLQARPTTYNSIDCTVAEGQWDNLNDPNYFQVTTFTVTPNTTTTFLDGTGAATTGIVIRDYTVTITARLSNDTNVTRTLTEQIRVRNDKFQP